MCCSILVLNCAWRTFSVFEVFLFLLTSSFSDWISNDNNFWTALIWRRKCCTFWFDVKIMLYYAIWYFGGKISSIQNFTKNCLNAVEWTITYFDNNFTGIKSRLDGVENYCKKRNCFCDNLDIPIYRQNKFFRRKTCANCGLSFTKLTKLSLQTKYYFVQKSF